MGWVMVRWAGSCRGRVDHVGGLGHAGVGWVM